MPTNTPPGVTKQNAVTILVFGEKYEDSEEETLECLKDMLLHVAQTADPPLVVIDLSHTTYFSSNFIAVLIQVWHRLEARSGGKLAICSLSSFAGEVLSAAQLDRVWEIYPTREEAVRALSTS